MSTERNKAIEDCIKKVEEMTESNCNDHTPSNKLKYLTWNI
jgi:hypothetical protein